MAVAKKSKAGEAKAPNVAIVVPNEEKLKAWIVSQVPDAAKCPNMGETAIYLTNELAKLRRVQPKQDDSTGGDGDVLAGIVRIEASLKQFKEQLSTIRQYSGLAKG